MLRRVQQALGIGRTTTVPNDTGNIQTVQVQFNAVTVRDGVPVVYHFGFTACLPVGTDVTTVSLKGDPTSTVAVGSNNQSLRPKGLQPGEVQIYDAMGRFVYFTASNGILINANNTAITMQNVTTLTVDGQVQVNGGIKATEDIVAGNISLMNHVSTNVQPGSGDSGPPK
jgi:phage gp45-like